jgi:hypothetical protein
MARLPIGALLTLSSRTWASSLTPPVAPKAAKAMKWAAGGEPKSMPAGLAHAPLLSWLTLIPLIHQMRRKPMPDSVFPLHGTTDKRAYVC